MVNDIYIVVFLSYLCVQNFLGLSKMESGDNAKGGADFHNQEL